LQEGRSGRVTEAWPQRQVFSPPSQQRLACGFLQGRSIHSKSYKHPANFSHFCLTHFVATRFRSSGSPSFESTSCCGRSSACSNYGPCLPKRPLRIKLKLCPWLPGRSMSGRPVIGLGALAVGFGWEGIISFGPGLTQCGLEAIGRYTGMDTSGLTAIGGKFRRVSLF